MPTLIKADIVTSLNSYKRTLEQIYTVTWWSCYKPKLIQALTLEKDFVTGLPFYKPTLLQSDSVTSLHSYKYTLYYAYAVTS